MKNSKENSKGFSLPELIVAIVILGILAAAFLQEYGHFANKEVNATKIGIHGYLQGTLALYVAANSTYPTLDQLGATLHEPMSISEGSLVTTTQNETYSFPTYSDNGCTVLNYTRTALVKCIGNGVPI